MFTFPIGLASSRSGISTPLEIFGADLDFWWDTTYPEGDVVALVSGNVSQMIDLTATNTTGVQGTSTRRPAWTASDINGHHAAVFDGTDDRIAWTAWAQPTAGAIYAVAQQTQAGTTALLTVTGGPTPRFGTTITGENKPNLTDAGTAEWATAVTDYKIFRWSWDYSGGVGSEFLRIAVGNGAAVETGLGSGTTANFSVINSSTNPSNMRLAFLAITAVHPTAQQHADMLAYLSDDTKFGSDVL